MHKKTITGTITMARPNDKEVDLFYKLYHAAQRVEDRWCHNTVGPIADELSHCPNLTRQEKMFLLRAWQVLVDGSGGFGRFMGAFDTYVYNMQDPVVDHVAYKPSLIQLFGDAKLLPVVIEAYQEALATLERKEEQRKNWYSMTVKLGDDLEVAEKRIAELEKSHQQQTIADGNEILALERRNKELTESALVPGVMHCAKCQFQLTKTNLYMKSGTTGPGDSKSEPCPNGCGPLWPVTWKQYATDACVQVERYYDECEELKKQLQQPSLIDVIAERQRQRDKGRDDTHDDGYISGVLALGGAAYAVSGAGMNGVGTYRQRAKNLWPFPLKTFNPVGNANPRHDLVRGAAMIIAEIDKIDRAAAKVKGV